MIAALHHSLITRGVVALVELAVVVRILLRPHRDPASRIAWVVGAASRSYYADLLAAGVRIHEYAGGLLHTKSLTLDGEVTLIGSANMDRRSFDLNYENNLLYCDPALTAAVRQRQQEYIARSTPVTAAAVAAWPVWRRLWNNAVATLGPVL